MKLKWSRSILWIGVLLLLLLCGLVASSPSGSWRTRLVLLKLRGALQDFSWADVIKMLPPGNRYLKDPEVLLSSGNPYVAISNPFVTQGDRQSGEEIFRSHCALCHNTDGTGGTGPDLTRGDYPHGSSDWALFRTISRGIPGSSMLPLKLPEKNIWQVIAYLDSISQGSVPETHESGSASPPVPFMMMFDRLSRAESEPQNWLTYSGNYNGQRFSSLGLVNRDNVTKLGLKWAFQMSTTERRTQTTPLVVDNVMYLTEPPNNVYALETKTGRPLFSYKRELPEGISLCCGKVNRGLAVGRDRLYMGTLDAHLIALDATSGSVAWDVEVADYHAGYSITGAPLFVKDKVIVGVAGGEYGVRGFLDAYDARTGARVWRFNTVPGPGEPGHETWSGDSWKTGGGPTWLTGSYDPVLNLIYWGVGNPSPLFQQESRKGDNLYSNSVVALDADQGKPKWFFQFTPHDEHDWDAVQIPVLADFNFKGKDRRLLLWANRNAFYYVLDRESGQFLMAREFAKQTWATSIDPKGRPVLSSSASPSSQGTLTYPASVGATNWWSPSYSPATGLLYVPVWESADLFFKSKIAASFKRGEAFLGSVNQHVRDDPEGWTAVRALTAETGELRWEYKMPRTPVTGLGGLLSTSSNLVFGGGTNLFFALDAANGRLVWQVNLGAEIVAAPITYLSGGKQQVTVAAGRAIFTFGLPE